MNAVNPKFEQSEICDRFRKIISWREKIDGLSQNGFARKIDVKPNTFVDYLKPEGQSKIRLTHINKILEVWPELNRDWLVWGEGPMLKEENEEQSYQLQGCVPLNNGSRDELLGKLIDTNSKLVAENAELRTQLAMLEKTGKVQSTDALNVFGAGSAAHTLQRKTE